MAKNQNQSGAEKKQNSSLMAELGAYLSADRKSIDWKRMREEKAANKDLAHRCYHRCRSEALQELSDLEALAKEDEGSPRKAFERLRNAKLDALGYPREAQQQRGGSLASLLKK